MGTVQSLTGTLSAIGVMTGRLTVPEVVGPEKYNGPYAVTPGEEEQVLQTAGLQMRNNVTVAPVPANYGRLEYNGIFLRVY